MRKVLFLGLLLASSLASAQYAHKNDIVLGSTGRPAAGATITVCPSGTMASPTSTTICNVPSNIYASAAGAAKGNPFVADGRGNYDFYTLPGVYDVLFTYGGVTWGIQNYTIPLDPTSSGSLGSMTPGAGITGANITWTGTHTFSNSVLATNFNSFKTNGIRNASLYAGADIGAKIMNALADFGVTNTCGEVLIPQGDYAYTTQVDWLARNGCRFRGEGSGGNQLLTETGVGTTLTYNGTGFAFGSSIASYHANLSGFKLVKGSGASTIGLQITNSFYASVTDVSVFGFSRNIVIYGGPAGTNVMQLNHVNSQNAGSTALEITGPGTSGQGGYNITVNGGQFECVSTTSTTGILINATSTDNNIIAPLINNCGIGIDLDNASSNTFIGPSIQGGGGTTPIRLSTATASNLFKHPYIFTGIGIVDNCGFACLNQFSEMENNIGGKPNIFTGDLYVTPYDGGTHPPIIVQDYDDTGSPRVGMYRWTGAGSNFYPYYWRNNAGTLEFQRADAAAIPALHGSTANRAVALALNPSGKISNLSGTAVVGQGAVGIVALADATAQSANIVNTTVLYAVPAGGGGTYRANCYVVLTRAATTSSTIPQCQVVFTDPDTSVSEGPSITASNSGNTVGVMGLANGQYTGNSTFNAKASTTIFYGTGGYASVGATTMQYAVHIKLEYLGN